MILWVRTPEGGYTSPVFMWYDDQWRSKALVLNQDRTALVLLPLMAEEPIGGIHLSFYLMDERRDNWKTDPEDGKLSGEDWLIDRPALSRALLGGQTPDAELLEMALRIARHKAGQTVIPEWNDVLTPDDANRLLEAAGGFHDAHVTQMTRVYECDDPWAHTVTLRFESIWSLPVELSFKGIHNMDVDLSTRNGLYNEYLDAGIFFENGLVYWTDDESVTSSDMLTNDVRTVRTMDEKGHISETTETIEHEYVSALSLRWRFILPGRDE